MKKDAQNLHDHVRIEAFLLSEKAGHPAGMDESFWAQAEAMVHGRTAVVVGPGKASKAKTGAAKDAKEKTTKKAASAKAQPAPKAGKPAPSKSKPIGKRAK